MFVISFADPLQPGGGGLSGIGEGLSECNPGEAPSTHPNRSAVVPRMHSATWAVDRSSRCVVRVVFAEVLEHIRTLEEKCSHLEAQVSDTAIDRLERLTTDLDDAKRLATNFEVHA